MGKPKIKMKRAPAPYTKYGKSPYQYSSELRQWESRVRKGEFARANRA